MMGEVIFCQHVPYMYMLEHLMSLISGLSHYFNRLRHTIFHKKINRNGIDITILDIVRKEVWPAN